MTPFFLIMEAVDGAPGQAAGIVADVPVIALFDEMDELGAFCDLRSMKEKDIRDISESYTLCTAGDGSFLFEIRRVRLLIGMVHRVQDFGRVGEVPTLNEFNGDRNAFRTALRVAPNRADVRKIKQDQSDTVSKAADQGKFKDERKWPKREPAFVNYLSIIPGVNGVPLSYVLWELEVAGVDTVYNSFNECAIACAPLTGLTSQADARKVH